MLSPPVFGCTFELWPSSTHGPFKLEHLFSLAVFTAMTHAVLLYQLHITCKALASLPSDLRQVKEMQVGHMSSNMMLAFSKI